ncbi:MAG TPA: ankyrin repeat domain-containing protein [Steroidobacteraceae bacterium]|nr:ankyrin repeat domain-containing protein [Steroidobacteraceae bacterium]
MSHALTSATTLEHLRKEAKRWLRALRAGDPRARQRLLAATPTAPAEPGLRDVQLALAREYALPGWASLRQVMGELALARRSMAERAAIVLRSAWDGGDRAAARRILGRWPELGAHDLYTAVVTGNRSEIERRLAADPAAATRKGGPLDWEPLLYLAYARLPGGDDDAVAIARLFLDHGADPNTRFNDNWENPFTALTGVIGEGEGDRLPHPQAQALATLLIERGADPVDTQAFYNTSITRDDVAWLDFLWTHSERLGRTGLWKSMGKKLGGKVLLPPVDYLLGNAVAYDHRLRAEWLLRHGADANGVAAYTQRPLREEALVYGNVVMADLLEKHGARVAPLSQHAAFQVACMRLDRETARALATEHPAYLLAADPMLTAARLRDAEVVALLLELGTPVDVADSTGLRGLHNAASSGALDVARLLIAHGADIDRPTTHYGGAMGFASHFGQQAMLDLLAPLSRDVNNLVYTGMTERLGQLFAEDPALVNAVHFRLGNTPLFALPNDEDEAAGMAAFLLAHGADPGIRNKEGLTPEEAARRRGLIDAADLMSVR